MWSGGNEVRRPATDPAPSALFSSFEWVPEQPSLYAAIPLSMSMPHLPWSPVASPIHARSTALAPLSPLHQAFLHMLSPKSILSAAPRPALHAVDDSLSSPSLSGASLGYSEFSEVSREYSDGRAESPTSRTLPVNPGRPQGKYALHPTGLCSHTEDWHRVRTKRSLQFYNCKRCGVMWCAPRAAKETDIMAPMVEVEH